MRNEQSTQEIRPAETEEPGWIVRHNDGQGSGTWGTMRVKDNGHLMIGGCDTVDLVARFGTPLFVYDVEWLRGRIREILAATHKSKAQVKVSYASKAFCTTAICQLVHDEGLGLDVVSGGELYTALQAGVPPAEIYMHGNNKSWVELEFAVSSGIGLVIVDNFVELGMLSDVAERMDRSVDVLLRIAPGVEAHTHEFISTGQQDSKFGFDLESGQAKQALEQLSQYPRLKCVGLHSHIGSQIFEPQGFTAAIERMLGLYKTGLQLRLPLQILNLGGGFGIRYTDEDKPLSFDVYMDAIESTLTSVCKELGISIPQIWLEPGRVIVGPPGTTLYTVGTKKSIPGVRNFVSVDGGMTDNPRLALYGAKYDAVLANRMDEVWDNPSLHEGGSRPGERWSVAGKCCETGDMLIWDAALPHPNPGDILAVFSTGAYNYSMASHYNRNPKPAVVFVENGDAKVVVERETWADLLRQDRPLR